MFEIDHARFGAFVARLRKEKGMSQKELAARLFVTDKAVSKWERGLSLPDISILAPLAEALGVTEGELLRGEQKERLWTRLRSIWALSPPWGLLLRAAPLWLLALLLLEPLELLLYQLYTARYGYEHAMIATLNPYSAALWAVNTIPSLAAGLWLSRKTQQQKPFPRLGGHPVLVWLRHCLPSLAIAAALWFLVMNLWQFSSGWWLVQDHLYDALGVFEQTESGAYVASYTWDSLPFYILSGLLLYGEYFLHALAAYFYYGLGVCRYLARRPEG